MPNSRYNSLNTPWLLQPKDWWGEHHPKWFNSWGYDRRRNNEKTPFFWCRWDPICVYSESFLMFVPNNDTMFGFFWCLSQLCQETAKQSAASTLRTSYSLARGAVRSASPFATVIFVASDLRAKPENCCPIFPFDHAFGIEKYMMLKILISIICICIFIYIYIRIMLSVSWCINPSIKGVAEKRTRSIFCSALVATLSHQTAMRWFPVPVL